MFWVRTYEGNMVEWHTHHMQVRVTFWYMVVLTKLRLCGKTVFDYNPCCR
jgi:hypothetical protein